MNVSFLQFPLWDLGGEGGGGGSVWQMFRDVDDESISKDGQGKPWDCNAAA